MTTDVFKQRGSALEDEFFRRVDEKLAQDMREKWQHDKDLEALKRETRIEDESVIEELLATGIHPGMIQVMTLVPAIHVAWANGFVETKERNAVMQAAHSVGISDESTAGQLLVSWLDHKPSSELLQTWQDYIEALHGIVDDVSFRHLHENAVGTARKIAEAAGGILGIHTVSVAEERAIAEINEAFAT